MTEMRTCPFEDCDWSYEYGAESYSTERDADYHAERHYEKEHAGRIRIQVTLETEELLGEREPREIRERAIDRFEETSRYDVAFVRTEVLEQSDDHPEIDSA